MERSTWIPVVVLLAIFGGIAGFNLYQERGVAAEGIVSQVTVEEFRLTDDGSEVRSGFYLITLTVDQRDTMIFEISPDVDADGDGHPDLEIDAEAQTGVPGSTVTPTSGVEVALRPAGDPYVAGPVSIGSFIYADGGLPSQNRQWSWYQIASRGWTSRYVPYEIAMFDWETGAEIMPWTTFVVGLDPAWGTTEKVVLSREMELITLGELLKGVTEPITNWAHIWNNDPEDPERPVVMQYVKNEDVMRYVIDKRPMDPKPEPSIGIINREETRSHQNEWFEDGERMPEGKWYPSVPYDIPLKDADGEGIGWYYAEEDKDQQAWLEVTDIGPGYFDIDVDSWTPWGASGRTWETDFQVDPIWEHYNVRWMSRSGGAEVMNLGTHPILNGKVEVDFKISGDSATGHQDIRVDLYGAADEWSEVTDLTGIDELVPIYRPFTPPPFAQTRDQVAGIPRDVILWNPEDDPLYRPGEIPVTNLNTQYREDATGKTAVHMLPGMGSVALVQIKAPIEAFDSVVYIPPNGKPEIISVSDIEILGGGEASVTVVVKNIGFSEDTFSCGLTLPAGMGRIRTPGEKSVPIFSEMGETATFLWVVDVGQVESEYEGQLTATVTAKNSLLTDSMDATVTLKPGGGPIRKFGNLTVSVTTSPEGVPVSGATVSVAGETGYTSGDGSVTIMSLPVGPLSVGVTPPAELLDQGYKSVSIRKTIGEGTNTAMVSLSRPSGLSGTMILIIVIVVIVVIVIVVIVVVLRKRGGISAVPILRSIPRVGR